MSFIVWNVEVKDANVILIGLDDGSFVHVGCMPQSVQK